MSRTEIQKAQQNKEPSEVTSAMRASFRYVAIGLGILAACAAFIALMVFLDRVVPPVWYGWARTITRNYSSMTPALWINWASIIAAGWALGVAYKLGNAQYEASKRFAILMLVIVLFGAIPAACALAAVSGDLPIPFNSSVSLLDKLGVATVFLTWGLIGIGVLCLIVSCVYVFSNSKGD